MYRPITDTWRTSAQDPTSLLSRFLASIVYHFDWIKKVARASTSHAFNAILLMFRTEIVDAMKPLVPTDPLPVISEATGIPPHVEQSIKLQKLLEVSTSCLELLRNQVTDVKKVRKCLIFNF